MRYAGGAAMQLDIFAPSLSLAFEYQGPYHYDTHIIFGDHVSHQVKDEEKRVACRSKNITLITIPFWWVPTRNSISATIWKLRPEVLSYKSPPSA